MRDGYRKAARLTGRFSRRWEPTTASLLALLAADELAKREIPWDLRVNCERWPSPIARLSRTVARAVGDPNVYMAEIHSAA